MIKHFKKHFALSDNGAKSVLKASIFSFLVLVMSMICVVNLMLLAKIVLEQVSTQKAFIMALCIISLVLLFVFKCYEYELTYKATYKESARLRISLFERLKNLPYAYFAKKNLSDLAQIIMQDVKTLENALSHSVPKIYALYFFIPLLMIMLILGDLALGLAVILPNVVRFLVLFVYKKQAILKNQDFYKRLRANSEAYQECIELNNEIKSFNKTEIYKTKLKNMLDLSEQEQLKANNFGIKIMAISSFFSFISLAIVLVVALFSNISVVYVLGYILAAIKLKEMIDLSSESLLEIYHLSPRINRLNEIYETKLVGGSDYEFDSFGVEFKNVTFAYSDKNILENVSFIANEGEVTALVGASGCGKSTILRLVARLYDANDGNVCLGGKDIKNVSLTSLYKHISVVFQETLLFDDSVLENVRFGKKDASDDEVLKALELANCMDFVKDLPNGIHTKIGENGQLLSGGQRQRIGIARAFLKNAKVLILDEITSSLDSLNECKIQQSLAKLVKGKTTLVVSHRLESIKNADKIVVLDNGKVAGVGKHDELIKSSKVYKKLNDLANQTDDFEF